MNLLAIDTSTDTLSLALLRRDGLRLEYEGAGGAQASKQLLAQALALLARADLRVSDLTALAFGAGPGAFTGLRTACAVAQGLAWGAQVPVLALETLMALAQSTRALDPAPSDVLALLDARMDEVYSATYHWCGTHWQRTSPITLSPPQALARPAHAAQALCVGNVGAVYADRLPAALGAVHAQRPHARDLLALAPAAWAAGLATAPALALPLYVRDKVAQTSAERAAARHA